MEQLLFLPLLPSDKTEHIPQRQGHKDGGGRGGGEENTWRAEQGHPPHPPIFSLSTFLLPAPLPPHSSFNMSAESGSSA